MTMKRIISIAFAIVMTVMFSYRLDAQGFGAPEYMKGKFVLGGIANLGFANNCFHVGIAPQAGYRLTRNLEIGARLGYDMRYYNSKYSMYGSYFAHFFSGAVYASYEIFSGIYVQVEDEEICSLYSSHETGITTPNWYNSLFVGGGFRQYFGESSYTYYSIMYNLSWDYRFNGNECPYASPFVIRIGFCKGL